MSERDAQAPQVTFSSTDLVKLVAATYLPLCDELEANGVLDRGRLADAMGLYMDSDEISASAALISALRIVLRRPRPGLPETPGATHDVVLRLIPGGLIGE
jgi:hypothetical protein